MNNSSLSRDLTSFVFALMFHMPLLWIKFDTHSPSFPISRPRIVSIDVIKELPKPKESPKPKQTQVLPHKNQSITMQPKLNFKPHLLPKIFPEVGLTLRPHINQANAIKLVLKDPNISLAPVLKSGKEHFQAQLPPQGAKIDKGSFALPTTVIDHVKQPMTQKIFPTEPALLQNKAAFVITGDLKDRLIEQRVTPEYPDWAQAKGVTASVTLEFTVSSDGNVKNKIIIRRTSGYALLDETAIQALRQWKFAALPANDMHEDVGFITFNYSLK